mmetsp:Transcript_22620/g.48686  ORF Transcript_22620/g.48686 Transcript_22620/m.48686 type:complete len:575 (+) Transcript_22620:176-1900(+)|eukprot:CAMPEP_0172548042 /NCGR_PEP_ID=MMETSP1067-20121228/17441_1 /TAXON_ID=265564 ORGANISM="Thalassiosira punctigera, Strain Tpunct2005C2" /NCGR_SAMPLE_ID=MMETSP1067 /ASSEMBLY_ACC=CAM_ASM_000444 /LENGTH=574 /DNA_ID=CAMNT_0013335223 /DNA_START=122 /DNA_END=1846 /DNA_ORIENTATION=+
MASPYYNASSSSSPPVVQGTLVQNGPARIYDHRHANHGVGAMETDIPNRSPLSEGPNDARGEGNWTKGEAQPRRCNDVAFAALFYAHLGVMAWVAAAYAPRMYSEVAEGARDAAAGGERDLAEGDGTGSAEGRGRLVAWTAEGVRRLLSAAALSSSGGDRSRGGRDLQDESNYGTNDIGDMMLLLGISALIALVISTAALSVMISHAQFLIKFALLFNIAATLVFALGSLALSPFAALMGIGMFALTIYYAYVVWGRIPFAACNLETATTAVRSNLGLAFFAYSSLFVLVGWSAWWMVSFVSAMYVVGGCDGQANCANDPSGFLVFAMLLSYYWTFQVVQNVVHVTVAGAVGTWWFVPTEGSSCCSNGVRDSFIRSVTTSFGSICLGSLLVAIIETSKQMVKSLRESEDGGGIFLCIAECLLACLQDLVEYFNKWAFVFVGLYGYTFIEAGKNVINLFKTRGWTTIITDSLAQSVLSMLSVAVGLITGLVTLAIAHVEGMVFGDELGASAAAFFIGFIIGMVLTSTLMTLVSSAVNTVIVCYAEAPAEFQQNHPKLSEDMRATWRQAWPAEFYY